jgi:hypothetical protein
MAAEEFAASLVLAWIALTITVVSRGVIGHRPKKENSRGFRRIIAGADSIDAMD